MTTLPTVSDSAERDLLLRLTDQLEGCGFVVVQDEVPRYVHHIRYKKRDVEFLFDFEIGGVGCVLSLRNTKSNFDEISYSVCKYLFEGEYVGYQNQSNPHHHLHLINKNLNSVIEFLSDSSALLELRLRDLDKFDEAYKNDPITGAYFEKTKARYLQGDLADRDESIAKDVLERAQQKVLAMRNRS